MKHINWSELTPVCYSIATQEDKDIGVAADLLFHNIRTGMGVHAGSYALGPGYTPDYKALKALWVPAPRRSVRPSTPNSTPGSSA